MKYFIAFILLATPSVLLSQEVVKYSFKDEFGSILIEVDETKGLLNYFYKSDMSSTERCTFQMKGRRIKIISPETGDMVEDKLYFRKRKQILVIKSTNRKYKLQKVNSKI